MFENTVPHCTVTPFDCDDTPYLHKALYHIVVLSHGDMYTVMNRQTQNISVYGAVILPPNTGIYDYGFYDNAQGTVISYSPCLWDNPIQTPTHIPLEQEDWNRWGIIIDTIAKTITEPEAYNRIKPWLNMMAPKPPQDSLSHFLTLLEQNHLAHQKSDFYANAIGISVDTLNNLCHKKFNKTMGQIIRERLNLSCQQQLLYTDKSLSEITHDMGFSTETYFIRAFKRETGTTPAKFRKNNQP